MLKKIKPENISTYLNKIESLFPEFLNSADVTGEDIKKYYADSFWGYRIFHSWAGAIHMALSPSGTFSRNDYFKQAEEVGEAISNSASMPSHVLEVGCGQGFNVRYLSQQYSDISFLGIDLSPKNIAAAESGLAEFPNATVQIGDFQDLSQVESGTIDVVFAVETLCHATDLERALKAISRVLTDDGTLIVYDGFRGRLNEENDHLRRAVTYLEKAMAVPRFRPVEEFIAAADGAGLKANLIQDRSQEIIPNLIRLSDFAKAFFKIRPLSKAILAFVPRSLVANAVAGLLMAVTVQSGAHKYVKLSFAKRPTL